jgi:hypothetical protein
VSQVSTEEATPGLAVGVGHRCRARRGTAASGRPRREGKPLASGRVTGVELGHRVGQIASVGSWHAGNGRDRRRVGGGADGSHGRVERREEKVRSRFCTVE